MRRAEIILIALLIAPLASALAGFYYGTQYGKATQAAQQGQQAVKSLSGLIDSHQRLIAEAAKASKDMRAALGKRAEQDAQTNKDFKNALAATADSRTGCEFPAGVMRQLAEASERAAQAAASGIHHPVPGASASTQQP